MQTYEYKVIPAPSKGLKARGVKGADAQFSHALETTMNDMAREGWTYLRAETLPNTLRQRLSFKSGETVNRTVLVFQREIAAETTATPPVASPVAAPAEMTHVQPVTPPVTAPVIPPLSKSHIDED